MQSTFDGAGYDCHFATQLAQGTTFLDTIDFSCHEHVMDVGCGNGALTLEMFALNTSMIIDAFDVEPSQIEIAKARLLKFKSNISCTGTVNFYVFDALNLDVFKKFDLVFSSSALHWIDNQDRVYKLLFEALVSGGEIAVHVGAQGTYKELHDVTWNAIENLELSEAYAAWNFPTMYFTDKQTEMILIRAGFIDVQVETIEFDESENPNIVEDFAASSLLQYHIPEISKSQFEEIRNEFLRICTDEVVHTHSRRLFIYARKP